MKRIPLKKPLAMLASSWKWAVCASSLVTLAGCASIGTQYVPPSSSQPSATLVPKNGKVFINTHDEKGCYQGRTEIENAKEIRLWPGRETIFLYETPGVPKPFLPATADSVCRAAVSFVPQDGASYTIVSTGAEATEGADGKLAWRYCGAAVFRTDGNGVSQPVPVKKLTLRQRSLACIQAVEE